MAPSASSDVYRPRTNGCIRPTFQAEPDTEQMKIRELLQWQWEGYAKYHQWRINLLIHIVAVPLFLIGTIVLVASLFLGVSL